MHVMYYFVLIFKVMSETVSKALRLTGGDEATETVLFIKMVDKMFDCLNVSSISKGKLKRKPFVLPYHSPSEFGLKVSKICFICE